MANKLAILSGAALAVVLVSIYPISAVARQGGGGGGGHGGGGHIGGGGGGGGGHIGGGGGGGPRMGGFGGGAPRMGGPVGGPRMGGFAGGPRMGGPGIGRTRVGAPLAPRGARFANRPVFHDRRFRHHRRAFVVAPAFGYYGYGYGYGYGCNWLRRNALATGSPYWWARYNACLYGY